MLATSGNEWAPVFFSRWLRQLVLCFFQMSCGAAAQDKVSRFRALTTKARST
jgi:hypothetical protein